MSILVRFSPISIGFVSFPQGSGLDTLDGVGQVEIRYVPQRGETTL